MKAATYKLPVTHKRSILHTAIVSSALAITGCGGGGSDGSPGLGGQPIVMRFVIEPTGNNCSAGGARVFSGPDANGNGSLEDAEVINSNYLCNATAGANGLPGAAGAAGATGAVGSVGATGATGSAGPTGSVGPNGPAGANGAVGANGPSMLIRGTAVLGGNGAPAGFQGPSDPRCPRGYGGIITEYGLDNNLDGFLDANEVINSSLRCHSGNSPGIYVP